MSNITESETRRQNCIRKAAEFAARQAIYAHKEPKDMIIGYMLKEYNAVFAVDETMTITNKLIIELEKERTFCISLKQCDDIVELLNGQQLGKKSWNHCVVAVIQATMHGHGFYPEYHIAETILREAQAHMAVLRPALCNALATPNIAHVGSRVIHQVFLRHFDEESVKQ